MVPDSVYSPVFEHYVTASENTGSQMTPLHDLEPFAWIPVLVLKRLLGTLSQ